MKYSYEYKIQCVEMYRQGKWADTPDGGTEKRFHKTVREWSQRAQSSGMESLKHKNQNKVWTAEDKYAAFAIKNAISILTSKNRPAMTFIPVIAGQFLNYILMILILIPF